MQIKTIVKTKKQKKKKQNDPKIDDPPPNLETNIFFNGIKIR